MGEIRCKVRLTNAGDIAIARRGMMDPSKVRSVETIGIVDTGAVRTIIPVEIMKRLGIEEVDQTVAQYADGRKETVPMTEPMRVDIMNRWTSEEALVSGDKVMIGKTVIGKLDLLADCARQQLVAHNPNQSVSKVR